MLSLKSIIKSILVTFLVTLISFYYFSRPLTSGVLRIINRTDFKSVEIVRDEYGIPHIYCKDSLEGALYGACFAQA
jgi:acyl-homoserine lactone acylase PvdQ